MNASAATFLILSLLVTPLAQALSSEAREFIAISHELEPVQCEKRKLRREIVLAEAEHRETRDLRQRIRVVASGKLVTSARAAWALCVGADFINTARGFMFSLGCIQALRCHQNTCPTGVTTHNKRLQRALVVEEKYLRVANYAMNMNREIDMIAHSCGVRHARELRREHVRIVQASGQSVALNMLYPYPEPKAKMKVA